MKIQLNENERIDDLEIKNMKIIQNKDGFCFGIDSVLLSDFAKEIKDNSRVVDLGTGTGILGILLCAKTNLKEIVGIEIQEEVAEMAQRSILLNDLENKFKILNMNIKEILNHKNKSNKKIIKNKFNNKNINYKMKNKNKINKLNQKINLEKNSFDYVITNPPYKKINTGKINENEKKLISRHELTASLDDFIETANFLLKDKGSLFMVHRPDRLVDILEKMRIEKIEPKEIRFVYPKVNEKPNLILIRGVKNAKPFLKVDRPLYVYDERGNYTEEILKIYQKINNK